MVKENFNFKKKSAKFNISDTKNKKKAEAFSIKMNEKVQEMSRMNALLLERHGGGTSRTTGDPGLVTPMEYEMQSCTMRFIITDANGNYPHNASPTNTDWCVHLEFLWSITGRNYTSTTDYWDAVTQPYWTSLLPSPCNTTLDPLEEAYPTYGDIDITGQLPNGSTGLIPVGLGYEIECAFDWNPVPCLTGPDYYSGFRVIRGGRPDDPGMWGGGKGTWGPGREYPPLLAQTNLKNRGFLNQYWETQHNWKGKTTYTGKMTAYGPWIEYDVPCGTQEYWSTPARYYSTFTSTNKVATSFYDPLRQDDGYCELRFCPYQEGPCVLEASFHLPAPNTRWTPSKPSLLQGKTWAQLENDDSYIPALIREMLWEMGHREGPFDGKQNFNWGELNPYDFRTDYLAIKHVNGVDVSQIPLDKSHPTDPWGPWPNTWTPTPTGMNQ